MTKKVPYKNDFKLVEGNELISQFILYTSVAISVITLLIDNGNYVQDKKPTLLFLNSFNCILAIAYFVSDMVCNYLFQAAEAKKRNDFFDNSLQTYLSEENSEGYFSNDHLSPGIKKMGVNCFENAFFSKSVANKMLKPILIKSALVLILFLCVALFTNHELLNFFLQLVLPFTIIQQTIRFIIYTHRLEAIVNKFQYIFSSTTDGQQTQLIIHNMTSYESNQAWACIKLDSKLFDKMNDALSEKWERIKHKYGII